MGLGVTGYIMLQISLSCTSEHFCSSYTAGVLK